MRSKSGSRRNGAEASDDLRKLFEAVYEEAHGGSPTETATEARPGAQPSLETSLPGARA